MWWEHAGIFWMRWSLGGVSCKQSWFARKERSGLSVTIVTTRYLLVFGSGPGCVWGRGGGSPFLLKEGGGGEQESIANRRVKSL